MLVNYIIIDLDSIFEEIEKQNTFNYENLETDIEKNQRIVNIVFSQLVPITDNMLGFQFDKNTIKEIITQFSNQYSIPTELLKNITKIVDEYVYEPNSVLIEKNLDQFANILTIDDNPNIKFENVNEKEKNQTAELYLNGVDNFENYYDIIDK